MSESACSARTAHLSSCQSAKAHLLIVDRSVAVEVCARVCRDDDDDDVDGHGSDASARAELASCMRVATSKLSCDARRTRSQVEFEAPEIGSSAEQLRAQNKGRRRN